MPSPLAPSASASYIGVNLASKVAPDTHSAMAVQPEESYAVTQPHVAVALPRRDGENRVRIAPDAVRPMSPYMKTPLQKVGPGFSGSHMGLSRLTSEPDLLIIIDETLIARAHGAMRPSSLQFKAKQLESLFTLSQVRQFLWTYRVCAPLSIPWIISMGAPMVNLAANTHVDAPAVAAVLAVSLLVAAVVTLLQWVLTPETLRKYWNVLVYISGSLFVLPIFGLFAACVGGGLAPDMDACLPDYPRMQPIVPIAICIVIPQVSILATGCSWYVCALMAVTNLIGSLNVLGAINESSMYLGFLFIVLFLNACASAVLSYSMDRKMRTGIWLSIVNKHGAAALAHMDLERQGASLRNDAFVSFAASSGQVLYELDEVGSFVGVTGACEPLLGRPETEVIGKSHGFCIHEEDAVSVAAVLADLRTHGTFGKPVSCQFRRLRHDDTCVWVQMLAVLEHGPTGPVLLASERDVTAERDAQEAILVERQRRIAASAAQAAHDETLGYACHELRNPLHVIHASLAFLRETQLDEEQTEHVSTISTASQQMRTLVDDILDVDRLRAGKLQVRTAIVSPASLVQNAMSQHRDFARVPVLCDIGTGVPSAVVLAGDRITQILNNGMTNAAKFTTKGLIRVRVLLGAAPGTLRFEVRNSGVLPNRPMFRAFESSAALPNEQNSKARSAMQAKGTGLGLRIASSLATALGGELNLENLPVLEPLEDLPDATVETVFWFEVPFKIDESFDSAVSQAVTPVEDPGPVTLGLHVLYVDDEPMNRRIGQSMLKKLGCTFEILEDGDEVLGHHPEAFDAILLDIVMQRMHGDETMRQLVAAGIHTPCFAVSGNTDQTSVQNYLRAGFREVVGKPFTMDQIRRVLLPIARERQAIMPGSMSQ